MEHDMPDWKNKKSVSVDFAQWGQAPHGKLYVLSQIKKLLYQVRYLE